MCEVTVRIEEEQAGKIDLQETAWDDVKEGELEVKEVKAARKEEVGYMENRKIWSIAPTSECWEKLGKGPVSVRWVDTMKRSRQILKAEIKTEMIFSLRRRR